MALNGSQAEHTVRLRRQLSCGPVVWLDVVAIQGQGQQYQHAEGHGQKRMSRDNFAYPAPQSLFALYQTATGRGFAWPKNSLAKQAQKCRRQSQGGHESNAQAKRDG